MINGEASALVSGRRTKVRPTTSCVRVAAYYLLCTAERFSPNIHIYTEEKKISADCGCGAGCLACILFALNKYTIY